jgi:hypothetical protein
VAKQTHASFLLYSSPLQIRRIALKPAVVIVFYEISSVIVA